MTAHLTDDQLIRALTRPAHGSPEWRGRVHRLLGLGWGVEDIAVHYRYPADDIRAEVQRLRDAGELNAVLGIEV